MFYETKYFSINERCYNNVYQYCSIRIGGDAIIDCCRFINCTFTYISICSKFTNCEFNNNAYPNECYFEEMVNDVYKNRLPEGDLIVYKKVYSLNNRTELVAKLLIPTKAKRVNGASNKCRAEYAKVLGLYSMSGRKSKAKVAMSAHDKYFRYNVGEIVKPTKKFDTSVKVCSTGIHFFLTFNEAKNYN